MGCPSVPFCPLVGHLSASLLSAWSPSLCRFSLSFFFLIVLGAVPLVSSQHHPLSACMSVYLSRSLSFSVHLFCLGTVSSTPLCFPSLRPSPHPRTPASTHAASSIRISARSDRGQTGTTSPGRPRGSGARRRCGGAGLDGRRLTAAPFQSPSRRAGAAQPGPSADRRSRRLRPSPGASHAEPRPRATAAGDEREEPK